MPVCPGPAGPGTARCHALLRTDAAARPHATTGAPSGYAPADLQSAYALAASSASGGAGATVAIVDAYDDPNAESDLGVYRAQFGLASCTTANGCFRKVNQTGGTTPPSANGGWAQEISLDLDMVSASCPNCHILLVEANSKGWPDLTAAVNYAASVPGVQAISNSYGGGEGSTETGLDSSYNHMGIAVTASSGDNGYGVEYPAASPYVTAVGGTSLTRTSNTRGWSETAWTKAGSGCSLYETKPVWQTDSGCSMRAVADVSADADPNTGVAVYDSYPYLFYPTGWQVFGGTSVASPIVASIYALGGTASSLNAASYAYSHTSSLYDVTSGSNGSCGTYLCTAGPGYDGPTGLGTPNGTGAFGGGSTSSATPETTITTQPNNPTNSTTATFSFTSTVANSTFVCTLDGSAGAACSSPTADTGLLGGSHTFTVAASAAGATDPTPASDTWTVDLSPPTVSITAPASGASVSGSAVTVSANATDNLAVASVQLLLDGNSLGSAVTAAPYSMTWDTTKTTNGSHTLSATATDTAGNSAQAAGLTVTVSNAAPTAPTYLVAKAVGRNGQVNLTWSESSTNVTSYTVERSSGGTNFTPIGTATTTSYSDRTGTHGLTYSYRVTATNQVGTSGPSNVAKVTTQ